MAKKYKTLSSNARRNTHEFLVDTAEDLVKLPKEPGSFSFVAESGDIYVCNNVGEWKNITGEDTVSPSGTLIITENGTGIDVTEYAAVDVNVTNIGGGEGNHVLGNWVSFCTMEDVTDVASNYLDGSYDTGPSFVNHTIIVYSDTDVSSEITLDDVALSSSSTIMRDGTLVHKLDANYYWPDVAITYDLDNYPALVNGMYNLDAYLVTPTTIINNVVTEVSVTPYTGVKFVYTDEGNAYYDISIHDIPDALPAAKNLAEGISFIEHLLPVIVWQAKSYD